MINIQPLSLIIFSLLILISSTESSSQFYMESSMELGVDNVFGKNFLGGGGISVYDFNDDGFDDLTFASENGIGISFYTNNGNGFDLVDPPYVDLTIETHQIVWVDYDNDGDNDLYVTTFFGKDYLYENDGNFNFSDVTLFKGLPTSNTDCYDASFADLNEDGYLELYVGRFGLAAPGDFNSLYSYNAIQQAYTDLTLTAGVGNGPYQTFASAFFDADMDGDLDLFIANDRVDYPNSLYRNDGNFNFVDISASSNADTTINSMNAGIGDFDMDGFFDIFITNIGDAVLLKNNQNNTFTNVAASSNTEIGGYTWGGNFFDYDNDRDEDLFVSNIHLPTNSGNPHVFLVNQGDGTFANPISTPDGMDAFSWTPNHVNAYGDFNNDGKLDLVVSSGDEHPTRIWINNEENENNYIKLDIKGSSSNKEGYGALIELWASGIKTVYHKYCTIGFQSQNSKYLNLGLGTATMIDSLVIDWPFPNSRDVIYNADLLINGMNVIEEGIGVISTFNFSICSTENLTVLLEPIPSQSYYARLNLNTQSIIREDREVTFLTLNNINLEEGFEVKSGATFEAKPGDCPD